MEGLFPVQLLLSGAMAIMAYKKGYNVILWTLAGGSIISLYFLWKLPDLSGFVVDTAGKKRQRAAGNRMALLLLVVAVGLFVLQVIGAPASRRF